MISATTDFSGLLQALETQAARLAATSQGSSGPRDPLRWRQPHLLWPHMVHQHQERTGRWKSPSALR
jgi:hypothetical protein